MSWGGRQAQALTALTLATYGTTCHLCGRDGARTADHVTPRSKGGTNTLDNLRPAHGRCNSSRGDLTVEAWQAKHQAVMSVEPSRKW